MDVTQLIAESGISVGVLTLTSVLKALLTLIVGLAVAFSSKVKYIIDRLGSDGQN